MGLLLPKEEVARIVETQLGFELIAPWSGTPDLERRVDPAEPLRIKTMMRASAEIYLGVMAAEVVARVQQPGDKRSYFPSSATGTWRCASQNTAGMRLAHS
jgi:hypothetical protein